MGRGPKITVDEAPKFSSPLALFPSQLGLGGVFPPKNQAKFEILELNSTGIGATNRKASFKGAFERGLPSKEPSNFFQILMLKWHPLSDSERKKQMVLQIWV